MQAPMVVVNQNAKRETGSIARANNIAAAKAVSDVVRTTLGPRSMLKMILDASGGTRVRSSCHVFVFSSRHVASRLDSRHSCIHLAGSVKGSATGRTDSRTFDVD
jgi:chaperonin GroEL (HSP60 family)